MSHAPKAAGEGGAYGTAMLTSLVQLHDAMRRVSLPLDVPGVEESREILRQMVDQLEDYIIPRVTTLEAPMLVVVGGSTGAGKSTLVNSLVQRRVTEPGLLRPTTRSPVLVHHPDEGSWFGQDRLLPDLERVWHATTDPGALQLVACEEIPAGLAILDAPDVDSVEEQNRVLAASLLAAADLWLFVTSAARYADAVPWDFLRRAADRGTAVAVVLDRTPEEAVATVSTHLARMLASRGLKDSPLFIVREGQVDATGLLPPAHVADIRGWLDTLAADAASRTSVVLQTLDGAVRALTLQTFPLAEAAIEQTRTAAALREAAAGAYDERAAALVAATADGTMLRGEVLARWQEFVGTGELLKGLETRVGAIRDRLVNTVRGRPQQAERVTVAVESGLELLVMEYAEAAAERAMQAWQQYAAGQALLRDVGEPELGRASTDLRRRTEQAVREWQSEVLEMVRTQGADKRSTARFLAFGVNGLSVALMMVVFSYSYGLTGAEVGIAGGSALLGQKLLEAVFGDQAVRTLAERARASLERRVRVLFDAEARRFTDLLDALALDPAGPELLRVASRRVEDARFSTADG
jgi:hypothetical protein